MKYSTYIVLVFNCALLLFSFASCREVQELQGTNFELALTSYKYLAILFYDDSDVGRNLENNWMLAGQGVADLPHECEMAKVRFSMPAQRLLKQVLTVYTCSFAIYRSLAMIPT